MSAVAMVPSLIFALVTEFFLSCLVSTEFFGSCVTAYEVPPRATKRAMIATTSAGDGRCMRQ